MVGNPSVWMEQGRSEYRRNRPGWLRVGSFFRRGCRFSVSLAIPLRIHCHPNDMTNRARRAAAFTVKIRSVAIKAP